MNFKWDGIRANIKDTILKFDNYGIITSNGVGYSGRTPQQWYRQNWINKNLTTEELEKLTHYLSGNVKGIAYVSLLKRSKNKSELLRNSIKDTSNFIFYQNGCIERGYLLSEYNNLMCNIENHQPCCSIELAENERNDFLSKLKILKLKKDSYLKEYYKRLK